MKGKFLELIRRAKHFVFSWDSLVFVGFVLVAAVLWFGHALGTVREMTLHVPVEYTGVPSEIYFNPALPDHLDVTLRDAGRRLIAQREDMPTLTFDLSDQVKGGAGKIHITREQIQQQLPSSLQGSGTTQIQQIEPDHIEGTYSERFNERKYTLTIETHNVPKGYRLRLFPADVDVLARVSQAHYNDISAKDITVYCDYPSGPTSREDKLPVRFIHRSKYIKSIRLSQTEVEFIIEKE